MAKQHIDLEFSDVDFGCDRFGYISRTLLSDDDEVAFDDDRRYRQFVAEQNPALKNVRCFNGWLTFEE